MSRRPVAVAAVVVVSVGLAACTFESRDDARDTGVASASASGSASGSSPTSGSSSATRPASPSSAGPAFALRPVVVPFDESVRVSTPSRVRPVAYVSMAAREVYVDRAFRDRASWLLDAHISVSTWVWRIPLPGDSPLTPISPGDELREFEELPIGAWDPSRAPTEGDIRIVVGQLFSAELNLGCAPLQGTGERISADVGTVEVVLPAPGEPLREDFGHVGSGVRHDDPECRSDTADLPTVDIFGWRHTG